MWKRKLLGVLEEEKSLENWRWVFNKARGRGKVDHMCKRSWHCKQLLINWPTFDRNYQICFKPWICTNLRCGKVIEDFLTNGLKHWSGTTRGIHTRPQAGRKFCQNCSEPAENSINSIFRGKFYPAGPERIAREFNGDAAAPNETIPFAPQ
jgi:hypothetical protein